MLPPWSLNQGISLLSAKDLKTAHFCLFCLAMWLEMAAKLVTRSRRWSVGLVAGCFQKAWKNWWKTIMIRIKCNNFCSGMFYISTKNQIGKESDFVTQHLTVWLSRLWTFTHNIHVLPSFSNFVTIVCTGLCSSPICERGTRKLWPWIRNVQSKNTFTLTWIIILVHGRYKGRLACGSTEYVSESILTEKVRQPQTLPLWFGKIAKSFLQSVLLV